MKTTSVRARITSALKQEAEQILTQLGLTTSEAIELFFYQVKLNQGIPFELKIPNSLTQNTFKQTDAEHDLMKCENEAEMFSKLGL